MPITFGGLASGLDTQALVRAILDFESQPLERLQDRRQLFSQRKNALNELDGKLKALETALRDLSSPLNFRGRNASLSEEGFLRATAGSGAEIGVFQLEVNGLAAASKVKSAAFGAPDQALVGDGQITLQAGANDPIVIDVDAASGNNSLEQIRDAINAADAGVQAAILYDGSGYRLTVRSEETGSANALTVTDTTDLGLAAAENLVTAAADASIVVDGIDVTSPTNKISNVIPGVTLDLISVTEGPVSVEVTQDIDRVVENVQSLISAYNETIEYFNDQFDRDRPGALDGDATARSVQQQLQSLFTGGVDGIPFGGIRSLASIGVSFDGKTGEATLDTATLRELLEEDFDAVGNLFLESGRADDPRIRFLSSTSDTVPGTYGVTITQAAEKATVSGSAAISALAADETLTVSDGTNSVDVLLAAGSSTADVVAALNAAFAANDVAATAIDQGGVLRIDSNVYGSAASVTVTSDLASGGSGTDTGFGTGGATDSGVDVAGTIGGVAATGVGQILTAAEDGNPYQGLQLRITATAAAVAATGGDFGTVSFSRGLVPTVLTRVDRFTRIGDGPIDLARESLDSRIEQLTDDIARFEEKLSLREQRLLRQFAEAERAIQALQAQQQSFNGVL